MIYILVNHHCSTVSYNIIKRYSEKIGVIVLLIAVCLVKYLY